MILWCTRVDMVWLWCRWMNERFTTKQIRSCRLNTKSNSLQITIITVQKRVLSDSVNHSLTLLAFTWIMQKHLFLSFHRASLLPRSSKRSYNLLSCVFPTTVSSSHAGMQIICSFQNQRKPWNNEFFVIFKCVQPFNFTITQKFSLRAIHIQWTIWAAKDLTIG